MHGRGKNGAFKRTRGEREADLTQFATMYARAVPHYAMAEWVAKNRHYTLSRVMVTKDLKEVRKRWVESQVMDFNTQRTVLLSQLEETQREAWIEWEKSKLNAEKTEQVAEQAVGGKGQVVTAKKYSEGQCGDPRYLLVIQNCIQKRAELLGMMATAQAEAFLPVILGSPQVSDSGIDRQQMERLLREHYSQPPPVDVVATVEPSTQTAIEP